SASRVMDLRCGDLGPSPTGACAAGLELCDQARLRRAIARIARGDVAKSRADDLVGDAVAGRAGGRLGEVEARFRPSLGARNDAAARLLGKVAVLVASIVGHL